MFAVFSRQANGPCGAVGGRDPGARQGNIDSGDLGSARERLETFVRSAGYDPDD